MKESAVKIRMHVMSPMHIGCDEVFEPTSFRVEPTTGKLHVFDPLDLIESLDDAGRKALEKVCGGDNLLAVFKEIARLSASSGVPALYSVDLASGLLNHYRDVLSMSTYNKDKVINQFILERTTYNPNGGFPYIPGSSIKGALKTAYLNSLNKGARNYAGESTVLGGSFENDPFRLLKISDLLPVVRPSTRLTYAVNIRKKGGKGNGPFQIVESIWPGAVFEGIINVHQPPPRARVKALPSIGDLLSCLNSFYTTRYEEDKTAMDGMEMKTAITELNGRIGQLNDDLGPRAFLLRLGRHGGAESHTLDGVRKIKVKQKGNNYVTMDHSTTIWLAAEGKDSVIGAPFGWAVLEMLPSVGDWTTYCDELRDEHSEGICGRRAKFKQAAEAQKRRKIDEELRLKRVEEEKRRAAEEEMKRKAELEALTDEERLIRTLSLPDVSEQQIVGCFNQLDALSSPQKEELAQAIKEYYVKAGKWTGGSKKQMEKVKKLKLILGG